MASIQPSATVIAASTATPMAGISSSQEAGIIAGGVIGAVLLFALAGFALYKYERRSRSRRTSFHASADTLVEKEKNKEKVLPSESPSIPPISPIPEISMLPKLKKDDNNAPTGPISGLPTSILRRPDPVATLDRVDIPRRGMTLRFREDTVRPPPPPGPLRLVGSPATDSSESLAPWQSPLVDSPPSRRSVSISEISAPVYTGLPPRPTSYLSRSPAASRTQSPAASRTQSPAVSRAQSPNNSSDMLPMRSAPPISFGFPKDPFRTPSGSEDGHGRRSLDALHETPTSSPAASNPMVLRPVRTSTTQPPMYRTVESPTPMTRTVSQMPISRTGSLRRVPSTPGRPGLPATPRPTVVIPPMPDAGPISPTADYLESLETPVYPSQFSPLAENDEPRYFTVDMGNGPTLARTMSARELQRAQTTRGAPMLWRHPTARVPRTGVDMV